MRHGSLDKKPEPEPEPDPGPAWADGMSENELVRINEWAQKHPISLLLSEILNSPRAIFVWIVLLMLDMIVLLFYTAEDPSEQEKWAYVLSSTISGLFAFDLVTRLLLHGSSTGSFNTFWRDRMNILDASLVTIDVLTVLLAVVLSLEAVRAGGAIKSFRSVRLVRLARVSRSVRVLRMGRIMAYCGNNFDWFIYQLDNKLQTPAWKAVGMFSLIMVFINIAGAVFYFLEPVAMTEGMDLDDYSEAELAEMGISYGTAVWEMWSFMADPGGHADVCDRFGRTDCIMLRSYAGAIAVFGICYFAAVLGFVVDGIRDFLEDLKKGTRAVIETDHIVILGFSIKAVALISEICDALESEGGGTIVIMDDLDKTWMEDNIKPYLPPDALRGSKIVARRGSPMVQPDLVKVSTHNARAVIVMALTNVKADVSDAQAVRVILALKGLSPPIKGHVVVELMDIDNRSIVELIGEPMVETVVSHDIIGRLMLLAVRNPGVNGVYDEVFGFQNDEFYIKKWPELEGLTFEAITLMMPDAVVLGFHRHHKHRRRRSSGEAQLLEGFPELALGEEEDSDPDWVHTKEGRFQKYGVEINPHKDSLMEPGDGVLVLAADDDSYHPTEVAFPIQAQPEVEVPTRRHKADRTLVCGWRRDIDDMIVSLDAEVKKGSEVHILCELSVEDRMDRLNKGSMNELKNLSLHHHIGNSAVRRVLEELDLASFHYVLILADEEREDRPLDSDAHNLATLLLLRDLRHRQGMANSRELLKTAARVESEQQAKRLGRKSSSSGGGKNSVVSTVVSTIVGTASHTAGHTAHTAGHAAGAVVGSAVGAVGDAVGGAAAGVSGAIRHTMHWGRAESPPLRPSGGVPPDGKSSNSSSGASGPAGGGSSRAIVLATPERKKSFNIGLPGFMSPASSRVSGRVALPTLSPAGSKDGAGSPISDTTSNPSPAAAAKGVGLVGLVGESDTRSSDASVNSVASDTSAARAAVGALRRSLTVKETDKLKRAMERKADRRQAKAAAAAAVAHADMCMIAVEILDSRTKSTLESEPSIRAAADYLLSHTTMSKVLAMVLMQREVKGVLEELLSEEGQSFFVHQATRFTAVDEHCSFWDVATRALQCNEVLVGFRPTASGTTIINPVNKHEARVWGEYDLVVVCCDTAAMMTPTAPNHRRLNRYRRNSNESKTVPAGLHEGSLDTSKGSVGKAGFGDTAISARQQSGAPRCSQGGVEPGVEPVDFSFPQFVTAGGQIFPNGHQPDSDDGVATSPKVQQDTERAKSSLTDEGVSDEGVSDEVINLVMNDTAGAFKRVPSEPSDNGQLFDDGDYSDESESAEASSEGGAGGSEPSVEAVGGLSKKKSGAKKSARRPSSKKSSGSESLPISKSTDDLGGATEEKNHVVLEKSPSRRSSPSPRPSVGNLFNGGPVLGSPLTSPKTASSDGNS